MADRPILFSAPMIRAILREIEQPGSGKTQTRRVLRCGREPIIRPDDRLWCRETLKRAPHLWTYAADGDEVGWPARGELAGKKRDTIVSIHMPRIASRITLMVTGVKVERLQDISEEDARAEGFAPREELRAVGMTPTARGTFSKYWDEINRGSIPRNPNSWAGNPWVAAYTFKPVLANIDALGEVA